MVEYVERTIPEWIEFAAKRGEEATADPIVLAPEDFEEIDGELYLDGMEPGEWLDAMLGD